MSLGGTDREGRLIPDGSGSAILIIDSTTGGSAILGRVRGVK